MLVKFISEKRIKYFPGWIKENGTVFTNNAAEEKAAAYGYKKLVMDDTPEYNQDTQYLTAYYTEEETCVRKSWGIKEQEETT